MDTKQLRQKILDLAIHGRLVPQEPNDEPASVLLERIRAEKEQQIKEGKIKKSKKSVKTSDTPHYEQVPQNWTFCRLDELCSIKGGKRIPRGKTFAKEKTPHAYLRVSDMKNNTINLSDLKYIDEETYDQIKNYTINSSDLYLTIAGTIGSVGIIPQEVDGMNLTENAAKLTHITCNKSYLLYALQSDDVQQHFASRFHQVAQPKLSIETASATLIYLPPIKEQQRIVAEIEKWFALVDIIEQGKDNLQATITQAKSKILDLAIHGKLVPQDPSDEPAISLLRRINPKFTPCDNGQYGNIPSSWTCCRLSDVANSELGKTLDREKNTGSLHPYLCSINILWNRIDLSVVKEMRIEDSELTKYEVNNGDLLICEGGESGRCAIWDKDTIIYYQNALHRVRFFDNISAKFFMYQLDYMARSRKLDKYTKGVTIKHLTKTALNSIPFVFPPTQEQYRIVDAIERIYKRFEFIQSSIETQ